MKSLLVILIPILSFSTSVDYDLNIYGNQNIFGNTHYVEYESSNFWEHHYYDYTNGYDACNRTGKTCLDNPHTHVGIDYGVNQPGFVNKVYSYGYGKIIQDGGTWGEVTIQNLVNSGKYYRSNLLHSINIHTPIVENNYITKYQYIGNKGHAGLASGSHLHLEITNDSIIRTHVVETATAYPCTNNDTDDCKDENNHLRNSSSIDGLINHYDNRNNKKNIIYYNPIEFANTKKELLPFLSKNNHRPTVNNFDVYGLSNTKIYGFLNIDATDIDKVGILSKNINSRTNIINNIDDDTKHKFLAESTINFTNLYGNSDEYDKGDYLFIPYVKDGTDKRYGYPVKFSFVDKGSFIIDNDKVNDGTAQYLEHFDLKVKMIKGKPICNDSLKRTKHVTTINRVPGYLLTSKLAQESANNYCDNVVWKVPQDTKGKYKIYAHVPKGTTATQVHYTIHTKNGDKDTKNINQTSYREGWVELGKYALDGIEEYELDGKSYVKLSLFKTKNKQWIAFDAIKFENISITYPDTKNLDKESKKAIDYLSNTLPIFSGYKEGSKKGQFGVGDNISRAELSKVIASMLTHIMKESEITRESEKYIKDNYTDWSKPEWFMKYARIVVKMNIMTGYFDEKKLKPDNNVTYRELSKIITQSFFYGKTLQKDWIGGKYFWHDAYYECLSNDDKGYTYTDDDKKKYTISSVFKQPNKTKIPGSSNGEGGLKAKREDVALFLYRAYMLWKNKIETASCTVDEENEKEGWGL